MNEIGARLSRPATYQDVLDAPPNMVAELAGGTLHLHPRPASRHALAAFGLAGFLNDPFRRGVGGPGGWWLAVEPELHLGADVLVPDLCGWRRERMPEFPDTPTVEVAPDWVCELLNPRTRRFDTTEKRDLYGSNGVGHLWHLDPEARTLEVFERRDGAWVLVAAVTDADEVRCPPFEAIGFPLSALWAE